MHAPDIDPAKFQKQLLTWYRTQKKPWPWRHNLDPYRVWVSEIMLQQTVIKAVLPVYERFMATLPTVHHLALAHEDTVRSLVRGLGYYRRFHFLHAAAKDLCAITPFKWPQSKEEWQTLKGIGDYTSSAIASIVNQEAQAAVDGNVERVISRLFDLRLPLTPVAKKHIKELVTPLVAKDAPGDFNQAMMELGQNQCRIVLPQCDACPVHPWCLAFARETQALSPAKVPKKSLEVVYLMMSIPLKGGQVGLLNRPETSRFLKGSLGFPYEVRVKKPKSVRAFRHHITTHKIDVYIEILNREQFTAQEAPPYQWHPLAAVEPLLIANLDRKALNHLQQMLSLAHSKAAGQKASLEEVDQAPL